MTPKLETTDQRVFSHRLQQREVAAALAESQKLGQDVHGAGSQ